MGNFVGVQTSLTTVGPVSVGPNVGDRVFIGVQADRGPANVATFVSSFSNYERIFGTVTTFTGGAYYSEAWEGLQRLFGKGRTSKGVWVTRIVGSSAVTAHVIIQDRDGTPENTLKVYGKGPGTWANGLDIVIADGTASNTFKLTVLDSNGDAIPGESWDNLTMTDASLEIVNAQSYYIVVENMDSSTAAPNNRPAVGTVNLNDTQAGVDDNEPNASETVGTETAGVKTGLKVFRDTRLGRGFLVAPGLTKDATVRTEMKDQGDIYQRQVLIANDSDDTPANTITDLSGDENKVMGYYYPRLRVEDASTGAIKHVSPVCWVIADWLTAINEKGVGKAPAGADFKADRCLGPVTQGDGSPLVDAAVAELLVGSGINPIWDRDGTGPKVWGARSTATLTAPEWKYQHVVRHAQTIADEIQKVLDTVVYEKTTPILFSQITQAGINVCMSLGIDNYNGRAPVGGEAEDVEEHGFFVQCDASLLSASDIENGILRVKVWFKPAGTAETIIFEVAKRNVA